MCVSVFLALVWGLRKRIESKGHGDGGILNEELRREGCWHGMTKMTL